MFIYAHVEGREKLGVNSLLPMDSKDELGSSMKLVESTFTY